MYRDVTPLLAIDEDFDRPASVDAAVTAIRRGNLAIVASADDAVATLVALGAHTRHAAWLVGESAPDSDPTAQPTIQFRMYEPETFVADRQARVFRRVQFHLQGQHDQKSHGNRGGASGSVEIPGVGDVDEYLAANPQKPGEPIFVWHGRLVDGLTPEAKHALLFEVRERCEVVPYIAEGMKRWREMKGLPEPKVDISTVPAPLEKGDVVARAFEQAPDMADDPKVQAAFEEFKRQSEEMYQFMTAPESEGGLGVKVTFWTDPNPANFGNGPYPDATAQAEDLRVNKHIFLEAGLGGRHEATMTQAEYDRFRAVHDVFGHAGIGSGFDRHGEYQAYLAHASMYYGDGHRAMASEYHGVNASVWAGEPGSPGTGKSVILPEPLIENPWNPDGTLKPVPGRDELRKYLSDSMVAAAGQSGVAYLAEKAGIKHPFAQQYDRLPYHRVPAPETETRRARAFRLATAQFHLRGRHDQKSHGNRGGSAWPELPDEVSGLARTLGARIPVPSRDELMKYDPIPRTPENESMILRYLDGTGKLTPERQAVHDALVLDALTDDSGELYPSQPEGERKALIMGGGAAAGKSTALDLGFVDKPPDAPTVNPDDFKILLPEARGPSKKGKQGNGLADQHEEEWASIMHDESSHVGNRAIAGAIDTKMNLVIDKTSSNGRKAVRQIRELQDNGYDVSMFYVTTDVDNAVREARRRGEEKGRFVSETITRNGHDGANMAFLEVTRDVADIDLKLVTTYPKNPDNTYNRPVLTAEYAGQGRIRVHSRADWDAYVARLEDRSLLDDIEVDYG